MCICLDDRKEYRVFSVFLGAGFTGIAGISDLLQWMLGSKVWIKH